MTKETTRIVPVLVVLPPRTLLLDVAGPIEVLRNANRVQDAVRFEVRYAGAVTSVMTSIGLELTGVLPLPERLEEGTMVVLSGSATGILGGSDWPTESDRAGMLRSLLGCGNGSAPATGLSGSARARCLPDARGCSMAGCARPISSASTSWRRALLGQSPAEPPVRRGWSGVHECRHHGRDRPDAPRCRALDRSFVRSLRSP